MWKKPALWFFVCFLTGLSLSYPGHCQHSQSHLASVSPSPLPHWHNPAPGLVSWLLGLSDTPHSISEFQVGFSGFDLPAFSPAGFWVQKQARLDFLFFSPLSLGSVGKYEHYNQSAIVLKLQKNTCTFFSCNKQGMLLSSLGQNFEKQFTFM